MTVSSLKASMVIGSFRLPAGADLVSNNCVKTDAYPLGAALIQFRNTQMYALFSAGAVSTCDQSEVKHILFSLRLRELADESGMTQKDFADALGIPLRTLESYISGARTPAPFTQMALIEAAERITKM